MVSAGSASVGGISIALVADVGEGFGGHPGGDDAALLALLTDANVACGFHAGDPRTMARTVDVCLALGVSIGAHPSFPDLVGFGRRTMDLTADEVRTDTLYQLGALDAFCRARGTAVRHISPHGALANRCVVDTALAAGVADAVAGFDPSLVVVTQAGALADAARERGLAVALLFFADRAVEDDGRLVDRREPGAVLHDVAEIAARAVRAAREGTVVTRSGAVIGAHADAVLLHGDDAAAVANAAAVRAALQEAGVAIEPVAAVLAAGHRR